MQKTTKAMKMVASAKLRCAQDRVRAARPYANTMSRMLGRLAAHAGEYHHPLLDKRGDQHYVLMLITADKGLCGGFNSNLIKAGQQFIRDNAGKTVELIVVGRRGRDFFRRRPIKKLREYVNVTARSFDHDDAAVIARELMELYTAPDSTIDRVFLIYNEFRSVLSQKVVSRQLLPIPTERLEGETSGRADAQLDYIYEQPPGEIFGALLPAYVETEVFTALVESVASEQGARMTAMDAASKNAGEVIESLTLNLNRARQASITGEIIEVVSGAQALQG
jgi:F-type H+-transporting ATPase subunit gamma